VFTQEAKKLPAGLTIQRVPILRGLVLPPCLRQNKSYPNWETFSYDIYRILAGLKTKLCDEATQEQRGIAIKDEDSAEALSPSYENRVSFL